ncbi:MAG TPA: TolC family protein [Acidobacteria bacterium]|nr:TolC family protein [Acidobacteriota bacterium]
MRGIINPNGVVPAVLAAVGLLSFGGCATYEARPLPPPEKVVEKAPPDLERLKVAAGELHHPLIPPVRLDLSDGLSPDEAAVLAVLANPELVAVRDAHGEVAAQLVTAGLLPNPELSAELDHPHGSNAAGTVNAYNVGLGIDITSLIGRAARVAEASAALDAVDLGIAWQEWQTAQAARLATVRLAMIGRRLELVRSEVRFEAATVQVLERAMERGDATVQDVGVHRSALEALRQLEGTLSRAEARTRSELNQLLGLPPASRLPVVLPKTGTSCPSLPSADGLVQRAATCRLDIRALEMGYEAQEARVRQAILAQFPSLSIGITAQRNESDINFLGGFITLGLPIFDRAQGRIAGERATRTRLEHEYEARLAAVRADVSRLVDDDRLLGGQIETARRGITSLARIEAAERDGVSSGDVDRLAWQSVRARLFELRLKEASLEQARLEGRVALETAVGGTVVNEE